MRKWIFLAGGVRGIVQMMDKGTEFQNEKARRYFSTIKYYSSNNPDTKAGSVAERVIRTSFNINTLFQACEASCLQKSVIERCGCGHTTLARPPGVDECLLDKSMVILKLRLLIS